MPLRSIGRLLGYALALDPGSRFVRALAAGGSVLEIPSLVARLDPGRAPFLSSEPVGEAARALSYRKSAGVTAVAPIARGVIADPVYAEKLFAHVFSSAAEQARGRVWASRPRVICGIGAGLTEVERRAFADVLDRAGARTVDLVPSLAACAYALDVAAAVGRPAAGRGDPEAPARVHLVAELGHGRAGVGVAWRSGVVASRHLPLGARDLDLALSGYLRRRGLAASVDEAARLREGLGLPAQAVCREDGPSRLERVRDPEDVLPRHVGAALAPFLELVVDLVREVLSAAPGEVVEDLLEEGLALAGDMAATPGLAEAIARDLEMRARVALGPETLRVRGLALLAEDEALLREVGTRA